MFDLGLLLGVVLADRFPFSVRLLNQPLGIVLTLGLVGAGFDHAFLFPLFQLLVLLFDLCHVLAVLLLASLQQRIEFLLRMLLFFL